MTAAADAWAWAQRAGDPAAKAVLLALANHADQEGACRTLPAALARLTEQSELAVHLALDELEGRGLVRRAVETGHDGRQAIMTRLLLPEAARG